MFWLLQLRTEICALNTLWLLSDLTWCPLVSGKDSWRLLCRSLDCLCVQRLLSSSRLCAFQLLSLLRWALYPQLCHAMMLSCLLASPHDMAPECSLQKFADHRVYLTDSLLFGITVLCCCLSSVTKQLYDILHQPPSCFWPEACLVTVIPP
jgi:hypothetical protein